MLMTGQMNPPRTLQGQYAGFVSRFMAWMIDALVVTGIVTILGFTLDIILRFFPIQDIVEAFLPTEGTFAGLLSALAIFGSLAFITSAYFVLIWTLSGGQSVGKALIGLRIVPLDGSKMNFWRSLVRYVAFVISALLLFLGLLWVLVSDRRQGWHDKAARTCVIYDWPARENDGMFGQIQNRWRNLRHPRRQLRQLRSPRSETISAEQVDTIGQDHEPARQ